MKNKPHPFQKRINYKGPIKKILEDVAHVYNLGTYKSHKIINIGYEDFNIILITNKGKIFIKIFAEFRDEEDCQRYVDIILAVIRNGVSHPKLYETNQSHYFKIKTDSGLVRLIVLEYIEGKTFFELKQKPNQLEKDFLVQQTSLINQIDIKPKPIYDSWAIVNFTEEYKKVKNILAKEDIKLIEPLVEIFSSLEINNLPHSFVHGDIIDTNVIRSKENKLFILDFSVSNVYPRIQELAVLLCDILFEPNKENFSKIYTRALEVYQEKKPLEKDEIIALPIFIQVAHAMHIIGSFKSGLEEGYSKENEHWMKVGREGLRFTSDFWK